MRANVVFTDKSSLELDRIHTRVEVVQADNSVIEQTLAHVNVKDLIILHENTKKQVDYISNLPN